MLRWDEMVDRLRQAYSVPLSDKVSPPRTVARGDRTWIRALAAAPPSGRYMGAKVFGLSRDNRVGYTDRADGAAGRRLRRPARRLLRHLVPHRRDLGGRRRQLAPPGAARPWRCSAAARRRIRTRWRSRKCGRSPRCACSARPRPTARPSPRRMQRRARDPVRRGRRRRGGRGRRRHRGRQRALARREPDPLRTMAQARHAWWCRSARPCRSSARSTPAWWMPAT